MNKLYFSIAFWMILQGTMAQNRVNSISIETFGATNTVGINYDTRFNGNCDWGYRVGIGYCYADNSSLFSEQLIRGFGMPLEVNYLLGKKSNKLELGVGTNIGFYQVSNVRSSFFDLSSGDAKGDDVGKDNRFGYFLFANIGYRHQRPCGFVWRAGVTPSINLGDVHGLERAMFYPYIGFGWSF